MHDRIPFGAIRPIKKYPVRARCVPVIGETPDGWKDSIPAALDYHDTAKRICGFSYGRQENGDFLLIVQIAIRRWKYETDVNLPFMIHKCREG